jgi:small-conductance mechanosensitive channel
MKLFLPSARATNGLLIVGFCALGYALYLRYLVIELSSVGLACNAGLDTWLCFTRRIVTALFTHWVFGIAALIAAVLNLLRPSLAFFAVALAAADFGIVLYNVALSALAVGFLVVSFARRAPEPE